MAHNNTFVINRELMQDNDCYGCGLENPHSMGIKLYDRDDGVEGLFGTFNAPEHATAFPNLVHPGAFFTSLVCLSVWTPYRLRSATKAVWFLVDTQLSFRKAAHLKQQHYLKSRFVDEGSQWQPISIAVEATDKVGDTLAKGVFQLHPFSPRDAMEIAGISELPAAWSKFLETK
jgi:hypothetical protein